METKQFTVTPETGAFIQSLAALENAKDVFLEALTQQYGEDTANKFFEESNPVWDAVTATISKYMAVSITLNLGPSYTTTDNIRI